MSKLERIAGLFGELEREVLDLFDEDNRHPLQTVFDQCLEQAVSGKGEEWHGHGADFMEQPWRELTNAFGVGGPLFQASKKIRESTQFLGTTEQYRFKVELLGAINYIAMAILAFDEAEESQSRGGCGGCSGCNEKG